MAGKMMLRPKAVHGTKPEEVTMPDGTVVKSLVAKVPDENDLVLTRVINLK